MENEIDNLHLVLITRFTKFQNLEELALKGYVLHITPETLEFRPEEITGYYRVCGIDLKEPEANDLYAATEGWISALYLLMLEYVADGCYAPASIYKLVENAVYAPLSAEIKALVITLSIFDSFTLEQAGYMWGQENTGELLSEITNKNAFVKYDSKTKAYHMHNIFTGFLKEILESKEINYKQNLYQKAPYTCGYAQPKGSRVDRNVEYFTLS